MFFLSAKFIHFFTEIISNKRNIIELYSKLLEKQHSIYTLGNEENYIVLL